MTRLKSMVAGLVAAALITGVGGAAAAGSGIGVKAGLVFAKQDFKYGSSLYDFETEWRHGLAAGPLIEVTARPFLAVRLETIYIQKGFKERFTMLGEGGEILGTQTLHYRIDYLSISLLAKGFLPTRTYALFGPRLDVKLGTNKENSILIPESLEDEYGWGVFGLTLGAGQEIPVAGIGTIFIEGAYYLDLGKVYDRDFQPYDKVGTLGSIENEALAIFAGVRF